MGNSHQHQKSAAIRQIERVIPQNIPWYSKRLFSEHTMRYQFASSYVRNNIVADIACGNGFGSHILAQNAAKKIFAVDSDTACIENAKITYTDPQIIFSIGYAEKIALKDKSVDTIISFETIEHLKKPEKCISEFKRILKANGIAIISTPNKEFSHGDNPFHLKEFTYQELQKLLSDFKTISYFGQRPVNRTMFTLYKKLETMFPFAKKFFRLRPWERMLIEPITNPKKTDYLYFIVFCEK